MFTNRQFADLTFVVVGMKIEFAMSLDCMQEVRDAAAFQVLADVAEASINDLDADLLADLLWGFCRARYRHDRMLQVHKNH